MEKAIANLSLVKPLRNQGFQRVDKVPKVQGLHAENILDRLLVISENSTVRALYTTNILDHRLYII